MTITMLNCYIINLDRATERWENILRSPGLKDLNIIRVPAVDGKTLHPPYPHFSPWGFFFCRGHRENPNHIACYNSHLKALNQFLESGNEHGLICEDDITGTPELTDVLQNVLRYSDSWDLVRLTGFRQKPFIPFADLENGYRLVSDLRCSTSAGCYLLNRKAAQLFLRFYGTMRIDYALAWFYSIPVGIREAAVVPFPVQLNEFSQTSQITPKGNLRYPLWHPYRLNCLVELPYRIFTRNWRTLHRLRLALQRWWFLPKPKG
jgi:glycosyl transferase family 25